MMDSGTKQTDNLTKRVELIVDTFLGGNVSNVFIFATVFRIQLPVYGQDLHSSVQLVVGWGGIIELIYYHIL